VDVAEPVFHSYGELVGFGGIGLQLVNDSVPLNWSFMQNWWLVPNSATGRGIVIEGSGAQRFQLLNGTHIGNTNGIVNVLSSASNLNLQVVGNIVSPVGSSCTLLVDNGAKAVSVIGNHFENNKTGYGLRLDRETAQTPTINITGNTRSGTNLWPLVYVGANLAGANIRLVGNVVEAGSVSTNWPYFGQDGGTISGNLTVTGSITGTASDTRAVNGIAVGSLSSWTVLTNFTATTLTNVVQLTLPSQYQRFRVRSQMYINTSASTITVTGLLRFNELSTAVTNYTRLTETYSSSATLGVAYGQSSAGLGIGNIPHTNHYAADGFRNVTRIEIERAANYTMVESLMHCFGVGTGEWTNKAAVARRYGIYNGTATNLYLSAVSGDNLATNSTFFLEAQ
jgi:hypothetical protein